MPDLATIPAATPATVARRGRIAALADAGIGATDAPTIARVPGCEISRVRAAVDAIAAADPSHGVAQARAILWAADSETRIADVAARVLAEGGGPAEIAREIVAIGGRVAP